MDSNKEYITIEEVSEAYLDCRVKKRSKSSAVRYEMEYELGNLQLWKELNTMTYDVGTSTTFCVTRPKLREVFAADFRDRIVHHLFVRHFAHEIEQRMSHKAYACRKGMGTQYAVRDVASMMEKHRDGWVAKCDIEGFFMSIDRDVLWGKVEPIVKTEKKNTEWWLWLAHKLVYHRPELNCKKNGNVKLWDDLPLHKSLFCTNGRGLPIGNLTSQVFANLYMADFDRWAISRMGEDGFGRYVDDFVVVADDKQKILDFIRDARVWLSDNLHLSLHPRKFYMQPVHHGLSFVGNIIKQGRIYADRRTIHNALRVVMGWRGGDDQQKERFVSSINSYYGFIRHGDNYKARRRLYFRMPHKEGIAMVNSKYIQICRTGLKRTERLA